MTPPPAAPAPPAFEPSAGSGPLALLRYVEQALPLGTWEFDIVHGGIRWSAGQHALHGIADGSFGGRYEDFMRFVHPQDAQRVEDTWRRAAAARSPAVAIEYRIVRPDGQTRWVRSLAETQAGADGTLLRARGLNVDITEDRRREHGLRLSDAIIANMAEGVVLCRVADGIIVYANARYEAMLGYGAGELLGMHAGAVNSPAEEDPMATAQRIIDVLQRDGIWSGVVRNRRKDGRDIWIRASIAGFEHEEHGRVWVNAIADVTEACEAEQARDRAAAELRRLSARVQEAVEAERAALSRDVHDQVGAALTAIRMRLEAAALRPPPGEDRRRAELLSIGTLAQQACAQARDISARLRPPSLDDLGIVETCRWYLDEWARDTGLKVTRRLPRLRAEPAPGVAIDLFRILQELLTNVARHAHATQVTVSLKDGARGLVLRVADDGAGIVPSPDGGGFGLVGVRERARVHGGEVAVDSGPAGTSVAVTIPHGGRPCPTD